MTYVSLYRKYRSQSFEEVVGQDHVTTTLARALTEDRLHHAYLFTGPRGTGKTSTARILAKSVNCESGPTATPCNACTQCTAITDGSHVDVIEIDAASHGGVDDVRELRDRVAFTPATARMKVYIVDECHMLSTAGWNAFLKTVEEPPGHVLFVFATTEPHKVLETILSRTQRFDFKRIGADALSALVTDLGGREGVTFEPGAVDLVVRAGDGSARDMLSVLDQVVAFTGTTVTVQGVADVLGAVPDELLVEAADLIASGDVPGLCILVQRLADGGHDLRQFARDAVGHLRELFLLQTAPEARLVSTTPERLGRLQFQAGRLGQVELLRAIELLAEAQAQMRRGNTRLPLEIALVKAALPEASGDASALAARLDRLERRTGVGEAGEQTAPTEQEASAEPHLKPVDDRQEATAPQQEPASQHRQESAAPVPEAAVPALEPAARQDPADHAVQPVDLEFVQRSWPAVIDATRSRSRRLEAFFAPGRPAALDGRVLTVEFAANSRFHAEQCASEEWSGALEGVLVEVLGADLRLRCVVGDGQPEPVTVDRTDAASADEAEAVAEIEAAEATGEPADESRAHEDAIRTLARGLGATVVEDGGTY